MTKTSLDNYRSQKHRLINVHEAKTLFIDCPFQKYRTTVVVVKNMAGGAGTDRQYSTVSQQLSLLAP